MKNLRCVIGATVFTPIVIGVCMGIGCLGAWLAQYKYSEVIIGIVLFFVVIFIWVEPNSGCKKYQKQQKEKSNV